MWNNLVATQLFVYFNIGRAVLDFSLVVLLTLFVEGEGGTIVLVVRARDQKFYDVLNNVKTNFVNNFTWLRFYTDKVKVIAFYLLCFIFGIINIKIIK